MYVASESMATEAEAVKPEIPATTPLREIDLAVLPANRLIWLVRLFLRSLQIAFWLSVATIRLPILRLTRGNWSAALGVAVAFLFTRLGATFIKVGQIISTRPDIFPENFLEPFLGLQDRVPPFTFAAARRIVEEDFGRPLDQVFEAFGEKPVASASVAQVHRAVLRDAELPASLPSKVVAVKVRRPGIVRRAYLDEAILRFGARVLALVPTFSLISPVETVTEFCDAVNKQLDFRIEADNNRRFRRNFEHEPHLVIPALVEQLCSDRVLTMEFIEGVKADKLDALGIDRAFVARKGLEGIARMIFQHGFIHADLHPGNMLFLTGNRIAVFDLGLVGILDDHDRRRFALLYYYFVSGMAADVARWFVEEFDATRLTDHAAFERDVAELVTMVHDKRLEEMQLTAALAKAYVLVRRHKIRGPATFTIANIAMMVVEGISRGIDPKLNLTREARPYLEAALALSPTIPGARASQQPLETSVPTQLAGGRYRIRRLLGEGVRKRVYLARDTRLDRDVAIALLRTDDLDPQGRARIDLEARAVARLADHPRIVPVYDTGDEDGVPYVVSQYMGGGTLSGLLLRTSAHRLPLDVVLRFADQICQALEHAHGHGVVHRDVKPDNVWLTEDGFAKLGDFGLARVLGRPQGDLDGMTVGTALYMPPEQALGRDVDQRSDLYSLGATLYELVTGRPPFEGETVAEVIASHIHATPEPPSRGNPEVPQALDIVILKLLAKRPEERFESAGAVRQALRDLAAAAVTTESPVVEPEAGIFVGREQEMRRLRGAFEDAVAGRGRLVVLVGEPGIGKTTAAELLASYATRRRSLVLTGRAFEREGAPAFWPWIQILRGYVAGRDTARLESELGSGAMYVAHLVPEIREAIPELPQLPESMTEESRFKLFDACVAFLKRASAAQPLVLFLDDLHWADKPSLLLLQFLTRELGGARILVVGAYRDVDVQPGRPLGDVLPELRRERVFERILLRGLPEDDVRALVIARAGAGVPEAFVRSISRETEGNPFFIEETLRHLVEEGVIARTEGRWTSRISPEAIGLPEGVRDVVGRRLARLSELCRRILTVASVLGREFDPRALERVADLEPVRVRELLDEARAARIVGEADGDRRERFTHALIRETLYASIGAAERVRLHQAIGDVLERLYAEDPEPHLSELAYHFCEAAPAGGIERAVEYATLAAKRADRMLAYEEAAAFYERAVRALETKSPFDEQEGCELLLALGTALWRSGEIPRAKVELLRACEVAESCGRGEILARAALLYSGDEFATWFAFQGDPEQTPLLERALRMLPPEDSGLRAHLMGALAGSLAYSEHQERWTSLIDEAAAMAERVGDRRVLGTVLTVRLTARWGADDLETIRGQCGTVIRIAEELRDDRLAVYASFLKALVACEIGDLDAALSAAGEADRAVVRLREPHFAFVASATRSAVILAGSDARSAAAAIHRMFELGGADRENTLVFNTFMGQRLCLLWQQGELAAFEAFINEYLRSSMIPRQQIPLYRLLFSTVAAESGRLDEARQIFETNAPDFSELHNDTLRLGIFVMSARIAERLGDVERASALYELLLPHADRCVVMVGYLIFPSVARFLGLAAKTLGRFDDAIAHFESAERLERQMPPWLPETQYDHARTLVLRDRRGDREKALALLGKALEGARAYGSKHVVAKALALKLELEGIADESPRSSIERVASSVEEKRPNFSPAAAGDGTVTLLFTDMENFSAMTERLGDQRAHEVMRAHNRILRTEAAKHGGIEVDSQGDGFLFAFSSARRGLLCAIGIQTALAADAESRAAQDAIRVRIGLHTGEAIREGKTFFGRTVILAARIAAAARGGEILVSQVFRELVARDAEIPFGRIHEIELKGLSGMHGVCAVGWDGKEPAAAPDAPAAPAPEPVVDGNVFRRDGAYWTIAWEGKSFLLKDTRGLRFLAVLLAEPGREYHALDLASATAELPAVTGAADEPAAAFRADLGDAGEVLDAEAKAQYRQRLGDLRAELEEAERFNDTERATRNREEIEFLTEELARATGLGGRDRKAASAAERARTNVTMAIRAALKRIAEQNPSLGRHFAATVRTGKFCSYTPDPRVTISWRA